MTTTDLIYEALRKQRTEILAEVDKRISKALDPKPPSAERIFGKIGNGAVSRKVVRELVLGNR